MTPRAKITLDTSGLDAMIDALHDLHTEGVRRAHAELDAALERTADVSRDLAHIHQGDLKASQTTSTDRGSSHWSGEVSYGSRGAAFELQRGGEHSRFIDDLSQLSAEDFEQALDSMFRGF